MMLSRCPASVNCGNAVAIDPNARGRAGAGVSVGTSEQHAPTRPGAFKSIAAVFPQFTGAGQLESIIVAVPDFPEFARRVREIVWSGL